MLGEKMLNIKNIKFSWSDDEKHEFGDGRARYEESGKHHEHLIDVETGEVIEFIDDELEQLKERIAIKMGYELVDHRLELFGKKLKIN